MKKTKKIVSTILGLLSAFSFKSSAVNFDIDDDDDNEFTYDVDYGLDNQKSISLGFKTLIGTGIISLPYFGKLYYNSLSKSPKRTSIEDWSKLLVKENYNSFLTNLTNKEIANNLKKDRNIDINNFFLKYGNKSILNIFCFYEIANVIIGFAPSTPDSSKTKNLKYTDILDLINNEFDMEASRFYCALDDLVNASSPSEIEKCSPTMAMAILRYLSTLNCVRVNEDGLLVTESSYECMSAVANNSLIVINKALNEAEKKFIGKNGNVTVQKYRSWVVLALGLGLYKKLYPNKEYDEGLYLRLQEQLLV